ncbi:MFS transporter [Desulfitibacter alkalitolerans]|uniref:MFS transporter n=1 Tax=Desulfitibacter alkalitolerans TaxID=264641 RepID=UPI000486F0D7|nr:MFS transporter [Desulfitibacter alkalitolerans]
MTKTNIRNMLFLFLITFAFFLSLDILQLPFPLYIEGLGGSPRTIGWLIGITGIMTVIVRPLMGAWSDVHGKKGILIIGMLAWFLSPLFLLMGDSFLWIAMIRIFQSIGMAGVVLATQALMAEQVEQEKRGQALALQGIGDASAIIIGPLIGFLLAEYYGFNWVFLVAALVAAVGLVLTLGVKEEKGPINPSKKEVMKRPKRSKRSWKELVKDPLLLVPTTIGLAIAFSFGAILIFMAVFANQLGVANIGYLFAFLGVFLVMGRYVVGRISDKVGREIVILPTILSTAAGMYIIAFFPGDIYFYIACALIGLGFGGGHTGLIAFTVDNCSPENRGFTISFFGNAFDLGISLSGFILGVIASLTSYNIAFFAGGTLTVVLGCLVWFFYLSYKVKIGNGRKIDI